MRDLRRRGPEGNVDLLDLRDRSGYGHARRSRRRSRTAAAAAVSGPADPCLGHRRTVLTGSLILLILAMIQTTKTGANIELLSWLSLALVSGFGIYGSVQFIRGKSAKQLIVALTLGVIVDVLGLVALPMLQPFLAGPGEHRQPGHPDRPGRSERREFARSRNESTSRESWLGSGLSWST